MIESVSPYIVAPIVGGIIGYITNDIAIRMLFRPHTAKYIFGMRIPFTPGIIPKEKGRIAEAIGGAISENLMNQEVLERYLLSDEIHSDLDYNEKRYNPIIKTKEYERLILALSPGKSFNLAGLHSSVLVIPNEELRSRIEKGLQEDDVGEPSYFSIEPVIAAYTKGDEYVQEENAYIYENKKYLKEFFIKNYLNLEIIGGNATYLLWVDISHYSNDSVAFVNDFSNKYNLFLIDGKHYHESQSSFVRINIATQKKNIIHLCNCLLDYLK